MPAGAGTDEKTAQRWRATVTIFAWLLILQSVAGLAGGGLELALTPLLVPAGSGLTDIAGASELLPGYQALPPLVRMLGPVIWAGIGFNLVLLAGAVGVLRRRKWGWYATVIIHILAAGGLFVVLPTVFGGVLALAAPGSSPLVPWLLALLSALPALAVVGFLLINPVLAQFERAVPPEADPAPKA